MKLVVGVPWSEVFNTRDEYYRNMKLHMTCLCFIECNSVDLNSLIAYNGTIDKAVLFDEAGTYVQTKLGCKFKILNLSYIYNRDCVDDYSGIINAFSDRVRNRYINSNRNNRSD